MGTTNPSTGKPWTKADFHKDVRGANVNPETGKPWTKADFHADINPDTGKPWTKGDFHKDVLVQRGCVNPVTRQPWTKADFHDDVAINPATGLPWTKSDFHQDIVITNQCLNPTTGRPWTKADFHQDVKLVDVCYDAYATNMATCIEAAPRCKWSIARELCMESDIASAVDVCRAAYASNRTRCTRAPQCSFVGGQCTDDSTGASNRTGLHADAAAEATMFNANLGLFVGVVAAAVSTAI
jgi:hypothetical protein